MKDCYLKIINQLMDKSEKYLDELLKGNAEVVTFADNLSSLADEIYKMKKIVSMQILSTYYEFLTSFASMCKRCTDGQVLKENIDIIASSLDVFAECMDLIISACKNEVYEEKEMPLVSVILPTYNNSQYVAKAIESVLNQTYSNIEFLVADDASTDDTVQEIMKYKNVIDYIHIYEENCGGNFRFLAERANGKYIAVMHSDDLWSMNKIEKQVEYMERNPECGACFTGVELIDSNGNIVENTMFIKANMSKEKWIRYFYENGNCLAHSSVMMKTEDYIARYKGMLITLYQLPDYWSWIHLLLKKEIYIIEESLTFFRVHESGENQNVSARNRENMARTQVEETYIWYDIIKNMDNEYFSKAFGDLFEKNDPTDDIEIMCEKMFVLLNPRSQYCKQAGIFYMFDITKIPEVCEYLKREYNWNRKDAKKITGDFLFGK